MYPNIPKKYFASGGHGHAFCSVMQFQMNNFVFYTHNVSTNEVYGEDEEQDS